LQEDLSRLKTKLTVQKQQIDEADYYIESFKVARETIKEEAKVRQLIVE
jgi:hypothetical protein